MSPDEFLSRRAVLKGLCSPAAAVCFGATMPPIAEAAQSAASWMDQWIAAQRSVEGGLVMSRFKDPIYYLLKPVGWKPNPGQQQFAPVQVPTGFVTDFASIPRLFWSALRPDGDYAYAAIIHDFLYWTQTRTREESDRIFEMAMMDFEISSMIVKPIYDAVSLGGERAWKSNAKLRLAGERRVLKKYPDDPRITWAKWKTQPDVFAGV